MIKKTFDGKAVVLPPDTKLQQKIGKGMLDKLVDQERLGAAQKAVLNNFQAFLDQVQDDLKHAEELTNQLKQHGLDEEETDQLRSAIFRIKGLSGTFEFALGTVIAKQLFDYLERNKFLDASEFMTVNAHVAALKSIYSHNIRGDGGDVGRELLKGLQLLQQKQRQKLLNS
jgi:chemotaxis protein histidine kinase CheA